MLTRKDKHALSSWNHIVGPNLQLSVPQLPHSTSIQAPEYFVQAPEYPHQVRETWNHAYGDVDEVDDQPHLFVDKMHRL